jgi:hypothetical protein
MEQPRPLVSWRFPIAVVLGVATTAICLWFAWIFVMGESVMTGCTSAIASRDVPRAYSSVTIDLTILHPGYDCVYRDSYDLTKVAARRRATVPTPVEILGP